jgi:hypothetical protein
LNGADGNEGPDVVGEVGWVVVVVVVVVVGLVVLVLLCVSVCSWRMLDEPPIVATSAIATLNVRPRAMMRRVFRADCMKDS